MFHSAKVKLTILYVIIMMVVSILFSLAIFRTQTAEAERILQLQQTRFQRQGFFRPDFTPRFADPEVLQESKNRTLLNLIFINFGVLVFSAGAAYYLAGRTLKPIENMLEEQKRFIADASHELRTPLSAMKTGLEVNLRGKETKNGSRKILESNLEEVNKLSYLSDKLLKLSRYEQQYNIDRTKVPLKKVTEASIKKMEALAKSKKIKIETKLEDVEIIGDSDSLGETISTILENSIKYSSNESMIKIDLKTRGNKAVLSFQDFGVGIKSEDIPHIFDRFYRTEDSRSKEKVYGFGLGLSIAKTIIDKHKGRIDIDSTPGEGTTFTIYLDKTS